MHLKVLAGLCSFPEAPGENLVWGFVFFPFFFFCFFWFLEAAHVLASSSRPAGPVFLTTHHSGSPVHILKDCLLNLSSVGQQPNSICKLSSPLPGNTAVPGARIWTLREVGKWQALSTYHSTLHCLTWVWVGVMWERNVPDEEPLFLGNQHFTEVIFPPCVFLGLSAQCRESSRAFLRKIPRKWYEECLRSL